MNENHPSPFTPNTELGFLAMQFRGARSEAERADAVAEYAKLVTQLIAGGGWNEIPYMEDMLPDEFMPKSFYEYWDIPCPHRHNRKARPGNPCPSNDVPR